MAPLNPGGPLGKLACENIIERGVEPGWGSQTSVPVLRIMFFTNTEMVKCMVDSSFGCSRVFRCFSSR